MIEAVSYFNDEEDPSISSAVHLLSPNLKTVQTLSYWEFINQVTNFVQALQKAGKLSVPHPWYNALLTEEYAEEHLLKVLDSPFLTGTEPIIIYPMNSSLFKQPLFMKPDCQTFYLLGALFNTSFDATSDFCFEEVIKANTKLYEEAKKNHCSRYLVDAHAFSQHDWRHYYGTKWQALCDLKEKYDPNHLLSTGFKIFPTKALEIETTKVLEF